MYVKYIHNPCPVWDSIRHHLSDDNNELVSHGEFMGVFDGERMAGAFLIKHWNTHCYEIHGGVHPDYFGRGPEICAILGKSIFAGTPCLKIVVAIPEFNRLMRATVLKIGMHQEGVIKKAFLKNMKLHDLYIYGACKSEVKLERRAICHHLQR